MISYDNICYCSIQKIRIRIIMSFSGLLHVLKEEYHINCGKHSLMYNLLFPNYCYKYLFYTRIYEYCRQHGKNPLCLILAPIFKFVRHRWSFKTKIEIPTYTIGRGLKINHTVGGIVINSRAKIGNYCYLSNGVIVGQSSVEDPWSVPNIGNYVHLAPNSKVFGKITVGDHALIGTDCVVRYNVPPNSCIVGNPARIVRMGGGKM